MTSNGDRPEPPAWPTYFENWDEYFLAVAETVARKSKDPRCQVGAVIVSKDKLVVSTGFNGLARGVYDDDELLADAAEKLRWICHAEANAILNAARLGVALAGCSITVTKFPCLGCCNAIVQAGISRIYTHDNRYWDDDPADAEHSRKRAILKQAGVQVIAPFHPDFSPAEPLKWKPVTGDQRKGPARSEFTESAKQDAHADKGYEPTADSASSAKK